MNRQTLIFPVFILLQLFINNVAAEQFRFVHYEIEHGLSSNTVRSICQDHMGFMWFGTENGLNRFDGHTFKTFRKDTEECCTLGNNYVFSLFEDSRRTFWLGTEEGIYIYYPETESFSFFAEKTADGVGIDSYIACITEDRLGKIWFASLTQGVFCYNKDTRQLIQYTHNPDDPQSLGTNRVVYLYCDSEDYVWACTNTIGKPLSRFDPLTGTFENYPLKGNFDLSYIQIYTIEEDAFNTMWLGSWNDGVCRLNKKTGEITNYLQPGSPNGIAHIHSLLNFKPGFLLIGSDYGLTQFNTITHEAETMKSSEFKDNSLSNNFIYPIYKDSEGGVWAGTFYGGVNYAPPQRGAIQGYTYSAYGNSVGGQIISCFCEDEKGNMWIGSDDGGLNYFDAMTNHFVNYMPEAGKNSLSYHNIHALLIHEQELWIGTYSGGLNILNLETGRFRHLFRENTEPNPIGGNSIYSLYKDTKENIWIGSMSSISRYDTQLREFIPMQEVGTTTIAICEDKKGEIWFGTTGKGLYRFSPQSGQFTQYTQKTNVAGSLPCDQISTLYIDEQNDIWIGTDEGLCKYISATDSFIKVPQAQFNTAIYSIIGERENLWIATGKGLYKYDPSRETYHQFSKKDGMQSDQFCANAGLLTRNGTIYLGTINGFNIINPRSVYLNTYTPPVFITNIQIFNKNVDINDSRQILSKSIILTDKIELPHTDNVISFEFAALSYNIPGKNRYRYIMEGFDKEWIQVDNQRKATYTNLPPGHYTFRVIGSNNDGVWNVEGKSIHLLIRPPFWRTSFAYFLYLILIAAMAGMLVYFFRKRAEQRNQEKLQQLREEKEKELHNAKINFFTMVAHEIRTPVSLIIGPMEKIMEYLKQIPEPVQGDIKIIDRNGKRLLSLVNQLLDFRKAEEGGFVLNYSKTDIKQLTLSIFERFLPMMDQKQMTFTYQIDEHIPEVIIDPEAVTKITSNLLTNAMKYARTSINLTLKQDQYSFTLSVRDDGTGISEEDMEHIFAPFFQSPKSHKPGTGLGLSLVKSLTEAHKGMVQVESNRGEFTEFQVTIPFEQPVVNKDEINTYEGIPIKEADLYAGDLSDQPVEDEKQQATPKSKSIPTILIVEDHTDMRNFLSENFEPYYSILLAENGKKALDILKDHTVDLIISDLMMPVMDGIELCENIKDDVQYSHIPFIMLTAKTDDATKLKGIQTGADTYIEKPFSPLLLKATIENLLGNRDKLRKKYAEKPFVPLNSMAVNKAEEKFLSRMNTIIENNISNNDFTIDILAHELGISRPGLFVKIRQLLEITPNELIQLIRLKKAAELLATKEYRINEICYMVGFNNPSYFAKCFQKQFGMLPKEFINQPNPG